jgi:hypothetical protein
VQPNLRVPPTGRVGPAPLSAFVRPARGAPKPDTQPLRWVGPFSFLRSVLPFLLQFLRAVQESRYKGMMWGICLAPRRELHMVRYDNGSLVTQGRRSAMHVPRPLRQAPLAT